MNAAREFVAGRGAVPIPELAEWAGRSQSHIYRAIGRGELRMFGSGRVTADSVVDWYESFEKEVMPTPTFAPSKAVPVAANTDRYHELRRRDVAAPISFGGGVR